MKGPDFVTLGVVKLGTRGRINPATDSPMAQTKNSRLTMWPGVTLRCNGTNSRPSKQFEIVGFQNARLLEDGFEQGAFEVARCMGTVTHLPRAGR